MIQTARIRRLDRLARRYRPHEPIIFELDRSGEGDESIGPVIRVGPEEDSAGGQHKRRL
jgi:hypothetical protein